MKRIKIVEAAAWKCSVPYLANALLDAFAPTAAGLGRQPFWVAGFRRIIDGRIEDEGLPLTSEWHTIRRRLVQLMPEQMVNSENLWSMRLVDVCRAETPLQSNLVVDLYERFPHVLVDSDFASDSKTPIGTKEFRMGLARAHAIRAHVYLTPLIALCTQIPLSGVQALIPLLLSFLDFSTK
jgi:hypothetical protein